MVGDDPAITISTLGISNEHGDLLKGYIAAGGANVTLKVKSGAVPAEDSYRWLSGEDDPAFGGAIRDMWEPTCLSDPGKVSDAEYQCDTSDGGGVHTNSGVPNHGYALLVDGGTYNGQTVAGIGLVKASHLYWRAQSVYQTPTTDFADHADALEASCTDLIGQSLNGLSTGAPAGNSGEIISSADCASVTAMIAAVELRKDPTAQCNFQPLLSQNVPHVCEGRTRKVDPSKTTFGHDLDNWTLANVGVYAGWKGTNWVETSDLPGGRKGTAAFAEDLDGQCDANGGDVSGSMSMTSASINLPTRGGTTMRMVFDHYIATEFGFDGGNVKISVNGGPFTVVPASAFLFNGPNTTLVTADAGNTNPLAGEEAFSGTDGGQVTGTWGQSHIDLGKLGVAAGDTIQIRFDFGMDGCGAIDGWYIQNVQVLTCEPRTVTTPAAVSVVGKQD
ncbi:MAG: M4 family metallopeptidase [Gaiellaceae bacterium MAG52_C11]|nr:M4 family metallopeptidase [Candidatus Gaiellasilicea maunaloa]